MVRRAQRTSSNELRQIILGPTKGKYFRPTDAFDEVYPGILIGDASTALSTCLLKELSVTHVLNAAYGKNDRYNYGYVNTSYCNYKQAGIKFMGIQASDTPAFYLRPHFVEAADFIEGALKSGGKVLVHCLCGISRSATLVAAYLMLKKGMGVDQAIKTLRSHRSVFPNDGFLAQLCDFDYELKRRGNVGGTQEAIQEPVLKMEETALVSDTNRQSSIKHSDMIFSNYNNRDKKTPSRFPLTTYWSDYTAASRPRARSEEKICHDFLDYKRARSTTPERPSHRYLNSSMILSEVVPSYRTRAQSVMPRMNMESTHSYTPVHTNYTVGSVTKPYPFYARVLPTPITTNYLRSKYPPLSESLTSSFGRDLISPSITPYSSYWYSSPLRSRAYSTYTVGDSSPSRLNRRITNQELYAAKYPSTFRHHYETTVK